MTHPRPEPVMQRYSVNADGRDYIARLVAEYSKYPPTSEAVSAYADEVEASLHNGNAASFEIRASHALIGLPMAITLPESCYDCEAAA